MQKFWEKTKETFTIGVGTAMEITGTKKFEETPEFLAKVQFLDTFEMNCKNLQRSLNSFSASINNLGESESETASVFAKSFEGDGGQFEQMSLNFRGVADATKQTLQEMTNTSMSQNTIQPILQTLEEISRLKKIMSKRKKNQILLDSAQSKYNSACEKGKTAQLPELQQAVELRKSKFDQHNGAFISGVDALINSRNEFFTRIFNSHQYFVKEMITQMKNNYESQMQNFEVDPSMQFPSISSI